MFGLVFWFNMCVFLHMDVLTMECQSQESEDPLSPSFILDKNLGK